MIIKSIIILFILQVILLFIPAIINNGVVNIICWIINMFLTFLIIKGIEKKYYKKYDKLASLLYNICPLLGVSIIFIVIYQLKKLEVIMYLIKYYIPLFIGVYVINIIYVILKKIKHS